MRKMLCTVLCVLILLSCILPTLALENVRVNRDILTIEYFRYRQADLLVDEGKYAEAAMAFGKLGDYSDARQRSMGIWDAIAKRETVSACSGHTIAVGEDGKVYAAGVNEVGQSNVSQWTDIVAVAAGTTHAVGLKKDGSLVFAGSNGEGQCNATGWPRIMLPQ